MYMAIYMAIFKDIYIIEHMAVSMIICISGLFIGYALVIYCLIILGIYLYMYMCGYMYS